MRREIAQLLQTGQEATARIRVEHIIREQNIMDAYEIVELFSELVAVRLPIIESQKECPLDLREAIASLCFAAPRCSDLPELHVVQSMFAVKYGKEFVVAASELRPDCGVNRQIIEKLSVRAPSAEVKFKLLKEIAEQHEVEWDPSNTEAELFKLHEDLLDGPTQFFNGSKMPLPDEKDHLPPVKSPSKGSISDSDSDDLDLPSVPMETVVQSSDAKVAAETVPFSSFTPIHSAPESTFPGGNHDTVPHLSSVGSDVPVMNMGSPVTLRTSSPDLSDDTCKEQFVPFITSPPFRVTENRGSPSRTERAGNMDSQDVLARVTEKRGPPSTTEKTSNMDLQDVLAAAQAAAESADRARVTEKRGPPSTTEKTSNMDLQDVLAAAQAAAESADRAAAAARAAANLAKVRISEIIAKTGSGSSAINDNATSADDESKTLLYSSKDTMNDSSMPRGIQSKQDPSSGQWSNDIFDVNLEKGEIRQENDLDLHAYQQTFERTSAEAASVPPPPGHPDQNIFLSTKTSGNPLHDSPSEMLPSHQEPAFDDESTHKPQHLNSMEDDSYYSYPNLFSSQDSFSRRADL